MFAGSGTAFNGLIAVRAIFIFFIGQAAGLLLGVYSYFGFVSASFACLNISSPGAELILLCNGSSVKTAILGHDCMGAGYSFLLNIFSRGLSRVVWYI